MCGIAGFFTKSFAMGSKFKEALSLLSHRGPDYSGIFENKQKGVALAHARLSILDTSSLGHQPMSCREGRVVLSYNGEIYNFKELRLELISQGYNFKSQSDTEVLLNLYLANRNQPDGVAKMLHKLNGIFAFAIWDADQESLLLVRDALGVKPLYYRADENGFVFASEIKALLPWLKEGDSAEGEEALDRNVIPSGVFDKLDVTELDRYLTFLWCPGEGTPSRFVRKLCPGQAMWVKSGEIVEKFTWYELPVFESKKSESVQNLTLRNSASNGLNSKDAILGTEEFLRQAVHRQMVADVPLGAFLSGGLDSSSVVAFAKEQNPNLNCFTIEAIGSGEEGIVDDLPYAQRVADHLKVPLEIVKVDASLMANDLEEMVYQLDEPLADPAPLNVLYISRLARKQGIKVLLSGAGGDDIFTGYRRHRALMSEKYFAWLPKPVLKFIEGLSTKFDQRRVIFRRLRKLFNGASLEGDARIINYFRWIDRCDLMDLYSAEFKTALGEVSVESPMLEFLEDLPTCRSRLDRILALEQRFFLGDHNLNYTDKMSMAEGVEVRVPFLDLDLVDFASSIPEKFKQRRGEGKWVLKKAMEPYLPKDVIYRPKSGFGAPLRKWMQNELRELLRDYLSPLSINRRGIFDSGKVQNLISRNDTGEIDVSYTLLSLLCIEIWCRRFIDENNTNQNCL